MKLHNSVLFNYVPRPLIALSIVTILVACAPEGHRSPNGQGPALPAARSQGTGDGGGGNMCQGRPIESYAIKVEALEAYKVHVAPYIENLKADGGDVYRFISYAIQKKNWYILPCEMEKISDGKIGSAVKTDQGARQTFREVYLNQQEFEKAPQSSGGIKNQADLIWHEIFMGLRLLKYDSYYNQCLAQAPEASLCTKSKELMKKRGTENSLTKDDYADVRRAAAQVFGLKADTRPDDWEDLLGRLNFDLEDRRFKRKDDDQVMPLEEFITFLQAARVTGRMPKMGGLMSDPKVSSRKCKVEIKVANDGRGLEASLATDGGQVFANKFSFDLSRKKIDLHRPENMENLVVRRVQIEPDQIGVSGQKIGERKFYLEIFLDDLQGVGAVRAYESVLTNCQTSREGVASCNYSTPEDAKEYVCARSFEILKALP
jgi:hypothetical protein